MDQDHASVWEGGRGRWRDRRTVVALLVAAAVGGGLGVVAGLTAGADLSVHLGAHPELGDPSTVDLLDGFDVLRAPQVGGAVALIVGMVILAMLRGGFLDAAEPRDLTRRRALIVGGIGVLAMILPWFLVGVRLVAVAHTTSGGPVGPMEHFYGFDRIPAVIAMLAVYVTVVIVGSLLRRSRTQGRG